jgi:4-hydroxybenzoate polyprenyltransferase
MISKIKDFGSMIKFSHTIFALPFAFSSAILAIPSSNFEWMKFVWILLAMVGARTAAMGFNRIVDARIDAKNPRTENRDIPAGRISMIEASIYVVLSIVLFVFSAYQLNMLCFYLSPVALLVILGYSYTKRFTWLCHLILGLGLSLAPVGAWIAMTGEFHIVPILLGSAVIFWVAGFDIIYSCQDYEFDRLNHLFSVPAIIGLKNAMLVARILHLVAFTIFSSVYYFYNLHFIIYFAGMILIGSLLIKEHRIISVDNLDKVGVAFFNMNGTISMIYFVVILTNYLLFIR